MEPRVGTVARRLARYRFNGTTRLVPGAHRPADLKVVGDNLTSSLRKSAVTVLMLAGVSMANACSQTDSRTTNLTSTPVSHVAARLPGESSTDASLRVVGACMDRDHISFEIVNGSLNGVPMKLRTYDITDASTAQKLEECQQELTDEVPATRLSEENLQKGYDYLVRFVGCVASSGHDMGVATSFEVFRQTGGDTAPSSRWELASTDDNFSDDASRCSQEVQPADYGA
jgi:hypothetical protein